MGAAVRTDGMDVARLREVERPTVREEVRDGARLAALRDLGLLDSPVSESFDRLTRIAKATLGVPVALVSLVDEDRQFFLSQQGLTGDWARFRQTPLSHSFCQHAVADRRPLIVPDARSSPLVATNLAVRDLDVIAYAGVPLILETGHAIGAVCAIDGKPRQWSDTEIALLEDIAATVKEIIDLRAALADVGMHDRLTGLPNRMLLVQQCEQLLHRPDGERLAVMCVGLDDFTQINQAFGTERADAVLCAAGDRLGEALRDSDFLGRLRGDMFVILADNIADEREALTLAGRIRHELSESPLSLDSEPLAVSATVGVALPRKGSRGADLITEAANAMRQAKRNHTRTQTSRADWTEQAAERVRLRQALGGALGRDEIRPVFQPIVALDTGQVRAYEALARWRHPELGDVSPADFIPAAESTADIIAIGEFMLGRACEELARWRETTEGVSVTVNLAPLQLEQAHLADVVADTLQRTGLPGSALILEITEGVLLDNAEIQAHNLDRLRDLGTRIALDDFGTGYSALGYLKRFPIDILKIDRSFIKGIEDERYDAALIQAILAMANGMDLDLVAEGVETEGQHRLLRLLGCRYGQGFLYARPQETPTVDPSAMYLQS